MLKLITELTHDVQYICEGTAGGAQSHFIEGVFMQAEKKNRNGRVYPKEILMREAKRYENEFVSTSRAMGELGHPDGPTVNLDRVSHLITNLRFEGNNIYGKAKLLDTPTGNIAKSLVKEGVRLGVSTRGMGSLEAKNGVNFVKEDFMLAAVDIVADPSAPDAFVNGIMESKSWVWDNGILREVDIQRAKEIIEKTPRRDLAEAKLQVWKKFIRSL